jgi:SAM-dependent methyltransferase
MGTRFSRRLRSFQIRDLGKLLALPNGSNFSVPGAGKTAVAYALYECERTARRVERLLIVAPLTDPPYHDDVQYHELSLPFRAWAQLPLRRGKGEAVVIPHSKELKGHLKYRGALTRIFAELRRVLKPEGRLLFSYANRESAAWVNLFAALRSAGFRPVGYTILHSENETDHLKRKGRSCSLDLILELAPRGNATIQQWKPKPVIRTDEEKYLLAVGDAFLKSGTLVNGWESELVEMLKSQIFVDNKQLKIRHSTINDDINTVRIASLNHFTPARKPKPLTSALKAAKRRLQRWHRPTGDSARH